MYPNSVASATRRRAPTATVLRAGEYVAVNQQGTISDKEKLLAAPLPVTWKWSSSRMPKVPGTTIIGSIEKHIPGASGVLSPRTR